MKPAPFAYLRPTSLAEAVAALAATPGAKVLAGGQSLVPLLSMRLAQPVALVDLAGVPGLDAVEVSAAGVRVGAMVRHADLLAHPAAGAAQPLLPLALGHVAHPAVRNRGTTVGSIVHADPAAEMPAVLALLGGSVEAVSPRGTRTVPAAELYVGPLETSLGPDEIATAALVPALPAGARVAFAEISRRQGDYAQCGVAVLVAGDGRARAAYLSVSEVPTVVDLGDASPTEAGEIALAHLEPAADLHASAAYRAQLVRVLTARALREARGEEAAA